MQVEGQRGQQCLPATGARVSNAYATYLSEGDSPAKVGLIPDSIVFPHGFTIKEFRLSMGMRSIR